MKQLNKESRATRLLAAIIFTGIHAAGDALEAVIDEMNDSVL